MMSGCILTQFLTGNKHGQSLEASGHEFYGSIAKTVQKLSKKITVRPGGGGRTIARCTPLVSDEIRSNYWSSIFTGRTIRIA